MASICCCTADTQNLLFGVVNGDLASKIIAFRVRVRVLLITSPFAFISPFLDPCR